MSKAFHVNTATGDIGPCRAMKGKCPFGEENHYDSLVGAAQAFENAMESELSELVVHWNPRTLAPARCMTNGCSVGVPRAEHFRNDKDASDAQLPRWHKLLEEGKLKGKELSSAVAHTDDSTVLDHVAARGTVKQVETLFYKYSRRVVQDGAIAPEMMAHYEKAVERGLLSRPGNDFGRYLPFISGKENVAFLSQLGMADEDIRAMILDYPSFFMHSYNYSERYPRSAAEADAAMVLDILEDELAKDKVSREAIMNVKWMDSSGYGSQNGPPSTPWAPGGIFADRYRALHTRAMALGRTMNPPS